MSTGKINIGGDRVIWFVVIVLSILSLLVVYSSTGTLAYKNQGGNVSYYILRHAAILLGSFVLMYFFHIINPKFYPRFFQILYFISVILLAITMKFGLNINGARRALPLPLNLSFQTFEFAKYVLVGYLARVLYKNQDGFSSFKEAFKKLFLPLLLVCALMFKSNLSTTLLVFVSGFVMMFAAKVNWKYLLSFILIGVAIFATYILVLSLMPKEKQGRLSTWKARFERHNKQAENIYELSQADQSKIAIATGGVFGKLPGNSTQRNFLPNPFSDFIYAIIVEEYGLVGGIIVLLLYLIFLYRSLKIALNAYNKFAAYYAVGLSFVLVFQALISMGVAVDIGPTTGQSLPMVSMGGTSVAITAVSIGILLSLSKNRENTTETIQINDNENGK
jgi:cell division protein FtsW